MRSALIAALAYAGTLAVPAPAAESPRAVVEATTSAVIAVLAHKDLSTDEKRRRVEETVYRRVDFDTLSRLVLGRDWNQLSEEQRGEFGASSNRFSPRHTGAMSSATRTSG